MWIVTNCRRQIALIEATAKACATASPPPPAGEGQGRGHARRFARAFPLPRKRLPYLHISRFRVADSGETLDFWSFPALGDSQGAVWCKSLFRLIFSNLCRYRSRACGGGNAPSVPRGLCINLIETWSSKRSPDERSDIRVLPLQA